MRKIHIILAGMEIDIIRFGGNLRPIECFPNGGPHGKGRLRPLQPLLYNLGHWSSLRLLCVGHQVCTTPPECRLCFIGHPMPAFQTQVRGEARSRGRKQPREIRRAFIPWQTLVAVIWTKQNPGKIRIRMRQNFPTRGSVSERQLRTGKRQQRCAIC